MLCFIKPFTLQQKNYCNQFSETHSRSPLHNIGKHYDILFVILVVSTSHLLNTDNFTHVVGEKLEVVD